MQPKEKTRDDGLADDWHLRNDQVIDANLGEDQALAAALNDWLKKSETALLNYDQQYADADTLFTQEVAAADQRHDNKLAVANKQFDRDATAAGLKYYSAVAGLRAALGVSYTPAQWEAFKAAEKVHRDILADDLKQARLNRAGAIGGAKVARAGEIGDANATRAADYGDAVRTLAASLNGADVGLQQADEAAGNAWATEVGAAETQYTTAAQQRHVTYAQEVYTAGQGQTSIYVTWVKNRTAAEVDLAEDIAQASSARQQAAADDLVALAAAAAAAFPSTGTQQALANATRIHEFLDASEVDYLAFVRATAQAGADEAIAGAEATAARRVTQASDQQTYANAVAAAKETWLTETVAAQEAADVRLEQDYAVRRAAFAEETAARLLAQAPVYRTYEQAVQTAEQDYQLTVIEMTQNDSVRLDQLDAALLTKITDLADIDQDWMSGGLAGAPPLGQPRTVPSSGPLPGAAAIIHAYADSTAADEKQEAYEVAAIQKTYEKTEQQKAKNRELADHASLKSYDDKLAAAVKQRYTDEGAALGDWHRQSAAHAASATTTAYGSLGTPYAQHVIALANADANLAATEEGFIDAYYAALGTEHEQALKAIAAERQTRSDAISGFRLVHRDAVSDADEKLAQDLADNAHGYTTGIAPAREMYRDALGQKRRDGRVAGIQAAVDNDQTFWHGGNYGLPPQPAKSVPPGKVPAVSPPKPQEQIVYGIAEAFQLGRWSVNDATALKAHVTTTENAYVTYVTQSGEERRQLSRKIADEQKELAIDVATLTKDYLNDAAGRVVTALTTFVTTHPSAWANGALSTAQANATALNAKTAATLTDATNRASAAHGQAWQRADDRKQKAIDRATADKDAAIRVANQAIFEAVGEAAKDTALALLGLYDIVDLPWEPRPGDDLPVAPFTLPEDIVDYAPRFVDTWFASVGTPEAVMVLSMAGTGAGSGGLPYSLIGSGAMFVRSTDDGGNYGLGPNGTNRSAARTSAWRKTGDGISSGIFSFASDAAASGTSNEAAPAPQTGEEHPVGAIGEDVTGIDAHGSGTSQSPKDLMAQFDANLRAMQPYAPQAGDYQQYPGGPIMNGGHVVSPRSPPAGPTGLADPINVDLGHVPEQTLRDLLDQNLAHYYVDEHGTRHEDLIIVTDYAGPNIVVLVFKRVIVQEQDEIGGQMVSYDVATDYFALVDRNTVFGIDANQSAEIVEDIRTSLARQQLVFGIVIGREDIEKLRALEGGLTFALHMVPLGTVADYSTDGVAQSAADWGLAIAGDAAFFAGPLGKVVGGGFILRGSKPLLQGRALAAAGRAGAGIQMAGLAADAGAAAWNLYEGYEQLGTDNVKAAGYFGPALLQLFGVGMNGRDLARMRGGAVGALGEVPDRSGAPDIVGQPASLPHSQPRLIGHRPTSETLAQLRGHRHPDKWQRGEQYVQELYGSEGQRHFEVPVGDGITGSGGRYVDAPVDLPNGGVLAVEVKTYGEWRTVSGVPLQQTVPLSGPIRQQVLKDVWLRNSHPDYDPRWVFLEAPPSSELLSFLRQHHIVVVIHGK